MVGDDESEPWAERGERGKPRAKVNSHFGSFVDLLGG